VKAEMLENPVKPVRLCLVCPEEVNLGFCPNAKTVQVEENCGNCSCHTFVTFLFAQGVSGNKISWLFLM